MSSPYRLDQKEPHILILITMSTFASMGAVIFASALPEISHYFNITQSHSQLTITLFLLGYAIGQLIYGPLANRFGRKKAFYIGIVVATIGSIISIVSEPLHSFYALILGRLLEALGSSAGLVLSFTIISDHYYPEQARRIIAYMMLAFAIVPGVATFIGGLLTTHFHWISCFYFLLIYGLLLAIPATLLAETAQELKKDATQMKQIIKNYRIVLNNKLLIFTTLLFGIPAMCVYVYIASAPLIAINSLHLSPQTYGMIGLIPFIGTALGSLTSARLSAKVSIEHLMLAGVIIFLSSIIGLAIVFYLHIINLPTLIGFGFILMLGNCIIIGNGASIATSTSQDKANASAIMNFINVGMVVIGTFLLAMTPGTPVEKLPIGFAMTVVIMIFVWFIFLRVRKSFNTH